MEIRVKRHCKWQEHRVGRESRRELLQRNQSNRGSHILGIRFSEKHNASDRRSVGQIQSADYIPQRHSALQLSQRRTYLHLQEAMEPPHSSAVSEPRQLRRLHALVFAWPSRHLEWASLRQAFSSLTLRFKLLREWRGEKCIWEAEWMPPSFSEWNPGRGEKEEDFVYICSHYLLKKTIMYTTKLNWFFFSV